MNSPSEFFFSGISTDCSKRCDLEFAKPSRSCIHHSQSIALPGILPVLKMQNFAVGSLRIGVNPPADDDMVEDFDFKKLAGSNEVAGDVYIRL